MNQKYLWMLIIMLRRILFVSVAVLGLSLLVSVSVLSGFANDIYLPIALRAPASPTPTSTSTVAKTPTPTVTPTTTILPSPTSTRTPTSTQVFNTGDVNITTIFFNGSGDNEPDEYVEIHNDDTRPIQLQGWTLHDIASHVFTFPAFVMQPGKVCRIYTNQVHPEWCGFSYGSNTAIWNNSGDCGYLRDSSYILIDDYCY
jgi:hypothetical protein